MGCGSIKRNRAVDANGRWHAFGAKRSAWTALAAAIACLSATAACGPSEAAFADEGETGTSSQGLSTNAWRNWGLLSNPSTTFDFVQEPPAICADTGFLTMVGVRRNSDKKYYFQTVQTYLRSAWQVFDGGSQNVAFASPPTCTHLAYWSASPPDPNLLLLAGKDSANRIRVLLGTAGGDVAATPQNPPPPPTPTVNGMASQWGTLDSNYTYSGDDGFPALSTSGSRVVLTFRARATVGGVERQRIYAYTRKIPFSSSNAWSSRFTAPDLPSNVTAAGTPAITYITDAANNTFDNKFVIVVRLLDNLLAWIRVSWNSTNQVTWGSSWTVTNIPYGGLMASDPAVDWDPTTYTNTSGTRLPFMTLYYAAYDYGDNKLKILNHSVPDPSQIGNKPFSFLDRDDLLHSVFFGAPRVTYGGGIEQTSRMLLINGYNDNVTSTNRKRTLLYTQDQPSHYEPPVGPYAP